MPTYERSPRVLVVEDDEAIAQVLQRTLRLEGYDVKIAADGVSALDHAHSFLPDLIILDLGLPSLDGVDVIREVRKHDADVSILVLSARHGESDKVLALSLGADDYVTKPFDNAELMARIEARLRAHPAAATAAREPLAVHDLTID